MILAQAFFFGFNVGEISCPTRYFEDASSINFARSVKYGFGVLATSLKYRLQRMGLAAPSIFKMGDVKFKEDYYREIDSDSPDL